MAIDYAILRTELQTDPNSYGYAALIAVGDDDTCAKKINRVRPEIIVQRQDVTPVEILEAMTLTHFVASPSALAVAWFTSLTQFERVRLLKKDGADTRVMTNLVSLFTAGSASETRLRALAVREGSRAEQLFAVDTTVTNEDVAKALRG